MSKDVQWFNYVDSKTGNFAMPAYLFRIIMDLMKSSLDFGTMLSNDPAKLRAFKEQTKAIFKKRWLDVAAALEAFEIIIPCGCLPNSYCENCSGSRYKLNYTLSPDEMREIAVIVNKEDSDLEKKLQKGLVRALEEVQTFK